MIKRNVLLTLLLALANGCLFCQTDSAPTNDVGIQYLGHVAVGISDLGRAMHFYCDQLGLTEAFRLNGPTGAPTLVYLRVNNNNFVELFPGAEKQTGDATRQTGLRHLGFFVKDLQATHAPFRAGVIRFRMMPSSRLRRCELMVHFCISSKTRMAIRLS